MYVIYNIVPHKFSIVFAIAFPATFLNILAGQNGFISAFLLGLGLLLLESNPYLAGLIMSFLIYKPHLGFLLVIALIAGRKWKTLISASLITSILVICTIFLFGLESWQAFYETLKICKQFGEAGNLQWHIMPTIFPAARLLGLNVIMSYSIQVVVSIVAIIAVIWMWSRTKGPLAYVALICGIFLVTPYAMHYDLVIFGLAIAWYANDGIKRGWLKGELPFLLYAWSIPGIYILALVIPCLTYIQVLPLTITTFLFLTLRRQAVFLKYDK